MVPFFGDFDTTETIYIPVNTFSSDDPSASVTITNLVAGDVEIHKDGGITQRSSDAGVTVTIDFDGVTGNHIVSIDLSDNTDAGFYANGSQYQVRIEGTTVDGGTINAWICAFSIGRMLRPTTNGRKLDVTATGGAGIDWGNVENPTTSVDLSATSLNLVDTATDVTNGVSLANGAVTNAALAENMEIVFETDFATNYNTTRNAWSTNVQDQVGTGNLPANAAQLGGQTVTAAAGITVNAEVGASAVAMNAFEDAFDGTGFGFTGCTMPTVTTLTGHTAQTGDSFARLGAPAGASIAADIAALPTDADVNAQCDASIETYGLDHLVSAAVIGTDVTNNSIAARLVSSSATADWDDFVNTTDSLQAMRDHIGDGTNLTEAGGTGDQLTAIDLPDQTMNITGNLSGSVGSVTGAVGSVTGAVGSVTGNVGGNVVGSVASVTADVTLGTAAITAGTIAADAIGSSEFAASAAQKIRDEILPTQNTAFNNIPFLFVAASDHVTPVTGATGTAVTRSIDGGAFGAGGGSIAEIANGIYQYDASSADMNGGIIVFRFTATGGTPGAPDDRFVTVITGGGV